MSESMRELDKAKSALKSCYAFHLMMLKGKVRNLESKVNSNTGTGISKNKEEMLFD